MQVVRAHCNYLSDVASNMWCDLFDWSTVFKNKIHTVGIFDECANHHTKIRFNTFDEQRRQCLYQSAGRLHISLVTKMHHA
jgi:hypothetical protein